MAGPGGGPLPPPQGVLDSRAVVPAAIQLSSSPGVDPRAPVDVLVPPLHASRSDDPGPSTGPTKHSSAPASISPVCDGPPVGSLVPSAPPGVPDDGDVGSLSPSTPATVAFPARSDGVRGAVHGPPAAPAPVDGGKGAAKPPSRPGSGAAWPPLPRASSSEGTGGTSVQPLSFAQVVTQSASISVHIDPHGPSFTDQGEPAAFFSPDEINTSCRPFDNAIVAKTPAGRPPYHDIRAHLMQRFRFKRDFTLSALDGRHMLLRFQDHEDYLQVLLKDSLFIHGKPFWFSKWTLNFRPDEDSPVVPVWMDFPGLPPNFYISGMLQSIACSIGPVLQIHRNTTSLTRTDAARVCVQMDVSKKRPERVWVGVGSNGFWQPIEYPTWPLFCPACRHLGHDASKCKRKSPQSTDPPARDGDSPIFCMHCNVNSHATRQCTVKPSAPAKRDVPQGRPDSNANMNKGKKIASGNGSATAPLGVKVPPQNWRVVGKAAPSLDAGPSGTLATAQGVALLDLSNNPSAVDGVALAPAPASGAMAPPLVPPGFIPAPVDSLGKAPHDTMQPSPVLVVSPDAPSCSGGDSLQAGSGGPVVDPRVDPGVDPGTLTIIDVAPARTALSAPDGSSPLAKRDDPHPGGSTPPPGGSTPVGIQEPPGLLNAIAKPTDSPRVALGTRLAFNQIASPAIVHQRSDITRNTADSIAGLGLVNAAHVDPCRTDALPELENTETSASDPIEGDTAEFSEGDEPPGRAVAVLGKPTIQALCAPGWDAASRVPDLMTVHSSFVGKAPPLSARPEGLPARTRLRRSASVPSQAQVSK